ncbi:flagellin [Phenylobacterium sp.]|jgi:flagellar hook-associated protein 3 FlgL|uniref:flagellin n=1 Tax=Phenylobacterium sp. TaxID=1871053 RepID=UPI002F3E7ECE
MNRISTSGNYAAVLANLMAAQQRQIEAGQQVSSQKKGDDLKSYARNSEMLTAMHSVQARNQGYLDQNTLIADRLTTQDAALGQVADAASGARQAIADALASGRVDTLVEDMQAQLRNAAEGMNARYGGKYLFAGGQIDTQPVTATSLSDLTAPATTIASFFKNDNYVTQAKLDDATTVNTGVLASDVGTGIMTAFKAFQAYQDANGPFTGALTDAQRTFLEGQISGWDQAQQNVTNIAGRNGLVQRRVDAVKSDLDARQTTMHTMIGGITDVDMATAVSNLQSAGIAVQAAAQVFTALQQSSLLNLLK